MKLTEKEIEKVALLIKEVMSGMTVNERLYESGLQEILDVYRTNAQSEREKGNSFERSIQL